MRRCGFFFGVFNLELPDYLSCNQFTDSGNPDICVGQKQIREAYGRALKPGTYIFYQKFIYFFLFVFLYIF